ncbi:MAG: hypothetical protein DWQ20_00965 [Actinobacteria bacterium]|nr:MAG: hypothetical protein DWQ20_00965 [Actinomycetota bacterium]
MPDNTTLDAGSGGDAVVTREVSHAGDTAKLPGSFIVGISGTEGSYTYAAINGDATNGLDVDVTRVGGTVTITGTVTANLGATDNAVLDAIQAATEATQTAVEGTLTVGSHAVTNAGAFAVQVDGDALTALQLIDDAIYVDDADWTDGTSKHMLIGGLYQSSPQTITDGDVGPLQVNSSGVLKVELSNLQTENGAASGGPALFGGRYDATPRTLNDGDAGALALSSAGRVQIDDGGGSITVDGTVSATVAGVSTAANQSTMITALQLIDDAVFTDDAAYTLGTSKGMMIMGFAGTQSVNANDAAALACDTAGHLQIDVAGALPAGTNAIGKLAANSGVDIGDVDVTSVPRATSHYRNIDANAESEIKGSAGTLFWLHVMNLTAAKAYLHLYDDTAANVTPGSTTPDYTFALPTQGDTNGAGFTLPLNAGGTAFANGITLVCTTTLDGSAGDPGTNGVIVNAGYA